MTSPPCAVCGGTLGLVRVKRDDGTLRCLGCTFKELPVMRCRKCGEVIDPDVAYRFGSEATGWEHMGVCPAATEAAADDPFDMHECEIHGVHRGPTCRLCADAEVERLTEENESLREVLGLVVALVDVDELAHPDDRAAYESARTALAPTSVDADRG